MTRVLITNDADADVEVILETIRHAAGYAAAAAHDAAFGHFYARLRAFPASAPVRRNLGPGIRIGVIAPYLVIYRYDKKADVAVILRILHGRRDITAKMLPSAH